MKKVNLFALLAAWVLVLVLMQNAFADVYASQLRISDPDGSEFDGNFSDGTGVLFSIFLNDTASSVTVEVIETETGLPVYALDAGSMSRGLNSVQWDGSGAETGGVYTFEVTAEQPNASETDYTIFYDSGGVDLYTRGVAVVKDQTHPDFGLIFATNEAGPNGQGLNIFDPDGTFHDPFLVAADVSSGGSFEYGEIAPFWLDRDHMGRFYATSIADGEIYRINEDYSVDIVVNGLLEPVGPHVRGESEDLTLYIQSGVFILRARIGTADLVSFADVDTVGAFSNKRGVHIDFDDEGFMYVGFRDLPVQNGRGISKFDITGDLPVTEGDEIWTVGEDKTFFSNSVVIDHGDDRMSASDDILYYTTRAGFGLNQDGVWRLTNLLLPDTVRVATETQLYGDDMRLSSVASIDLDAAGNIVFMENTREHIFFISPPGEGETNSFTTTSSDTVTVVVPTSVETIGDNTIPHFNQLLPNYPNPFNPTTTIEYILRDAGATTIEVYDLLGRKVRTLVNGPRLAGEHSVIWDGTDDYGRSVASGVYILTMESGDFRKSRRLTFLK